MSSRIILIDDPPAAPLWNMAADEWLFEHVAAGESAYIRFYEWSEPTLSLGYFQRLAEIEESFSGRNCAVVRRSTGGGAILHEFDLTYSAALPLAARWSAEADSIYATFHEGLIRALANWNLTAEQCPQTLHRLEGEPFLCFQRRAQGDVLLNGEKIAGSAQRRKSGALLQHGSVLLARSSLAPVLPGIAEIAGRSISLGELKHAWREEILVKFERQSNKTLVKTWSTQEFSEIAEIAERKFNSPQWVQKR